MNRCPPEEKLSAYLDAELPAAEAAAIEAHLCACPECSATLGAFRELDAVAGSAPAPAVSEAQWDAAWAAIASRIAAGRRQARRPVWRRAVVWVAAAAACLAVAAGVVVLSRRPGAPAAPLARECVVEELEAAPGYAASVAYSPEGGVALITLAPEAIQEAPANGQGGDVL